MASCEDMYSESSNSKMCGPVSPDWLKGQIYRKKTLFERKNIVSTIDSSHKIDPSEFCKVSLHPIWVIDPYFTHLKLAAKTAGGFPES